MRINRRLLISFDWLWFFALLALAASGVLAIWSTTEGTRLSFYFGRQLVYLSIAVSVFLVLLYFDYHLFSDYITFIYLVALAVLGLVLVAGTTIHSNKSWIRLGRITLQPSELVKLVVIVALAKYFSESDREHLELNELAVGGLIVAIPTILVAMEGDLGTAVTFMPIYLALSFVGGLRKKHIIAMALIFAVSAPVGWFMLKDYQKGRIETVFNPSTDPHRRGYQTIQSEIAIGSGKFVGKGFRHGSQGQLGFLPARHTDFVFAVLSEIWGFVGSITLLMLFLFVTYRMLRAARESKDRLGAMIIVGVVGLFLFHVFINVGMVLGLLPIAGIPLPFVSAGGSSLISFFAAMSLCMNIKMRRYVN